MAVRPPADLHDAVAALDKARAAAKVADDYYDGRQAERFILASISNAQQRRLARERQAFRFRFPGVVVDAVTDRLDVADWVTPDDTAAGALADVFARNELTFELPAAMASAARHGEAFVLVTPPADDDAARVTWAPAGHATILYETADPITQRVAAHRWTVAAPGGAVDRCDLYYSDRVEQWQKRSGGQWEPAPVARGDDDPVADDGTPTHHLVWDWPWPALWHLRTGRPNPEPVHAGAYGPQDVLTKLVANLVASSDFAAWPQRFERFGPSTVEAPPSILFDDDDDDGIDETTDAEAADKATYDAGAGTVWRMIADEVGQFDAADLSRFTVTAGHVIEWMAATTSTPLERFKGWVAAPAGVAVREMRRDYRARVQRIRDAFEHPLAGALGAAVAATLDSPEPPEPVGVVWAPIEVRDDPESLQTAALEVELGVPPAQALGRLGIYTPDQLAEWLTAGAGDVASLVEVAGLAGRLALAVGTVIDQAQAQAIVVEAARRAGVDL